MGGTKATNRTVGDTTMWLFKKKCQQRIDKEGNIHTKKTSAMAKKIDKI
jgi:hypothetical protein